jgi:succinate dehydrogenase flavin-adding protein (antitoxin of CptAB toxin-antitoxin module)
MRELDVLLLRYLEHGYAAASSRERDAFGQLLELPDPDVLGYLVGRAAPPDAAMRQVIASILGTETRDTDAAGL